MASFDPGRVFVTGATGLLGARLCEVLLAAGAEVTALSRRTGASGLPEGVRVVQGDASTTGAWLEELDGQQAVVHLAGEPVVGPRWTAARKAALVASRVEGAARIAAAIRGASAPPEVLVCASASGFYGSRGDELLDETAQPGDDFLARLCVDWERAAFSAASEQTRVVALRFGVILSRRGGALARMRPIFRLGLGGPLGPASRFFPWVHEDDALGLVRLALAGGPGALRGPVNVVSPEPTRMGEFARAMGRTLGRPAVLPVPLPLLRLGLGEAATGMVPGQRIVPRAALEAGYGFAFAGIDAALGDLLGPVAEAGSAT
jgi:uncharacterized protein (TIGR01777 family)